ncbi:MAG TPA: G1 family glutamic endopeptidase [Streptosporangiaceae bacterium]
MVGALAAMGLAAGPSTAAVRPGTAASAAAAARAAMSGLLGQHGPGGWGGNHQATPGAGKVSKIRNLAVLKATNWGGYVDTTGAPGNYTGVSGNWSQPTVRCTATNSYAAFWVGMDGMNNATLEAAGTLGECYEGVAYYYTWWEMDPNTSVELVGSSIRPGDAIAASVTRNGSAFTLSVTDTTHPNIRLAARRSVLPSNADNFVIHQSCVDCPGYTIEWIIGQPGPWDSSEGYALSNFDNWTVLNALGRTISDQGGISSFPYDEVTMVDPSDTVMIQPTVLQGGGFTDNFENGM